MNYNEALESNLDNVNADCYSDLRNIDNYKHDNKWTFKLTYPSVRLDGKGVVVVVVSVIARSLTSGSALNNALPAA